MNTEAPHLSLPNPAGKGHPHDARISYDDKRAHVGAERYYGWTAKHGALCM
jgi:hypothetical protein